MSSADRRRIEGEVRAGISRVRSTFADLTDDQLATRVHEGDSGWTAKQVLAHLAGRSESYDLIFKVADGEPFPSDFDVDAFNKRLVDAREGWGRDELLVEFTDVHEALIRRAYETPDDILHRGLTISGYQMTCSEWLIATGGRHSITHAEEVEVALGLTPQRTTV